MIFLATYFIMVALKNCGHNKFQILSVYSLGALIKLLSYYYMV